MTDRFGLAETAGSGGAPAPMSRYRTTDANCRTIAAPGSVEQHVVRACRAVRRLGKIDLEVGIELHAPVVSDLDQLHRVARRVIDAADRRIGEVQPPAVESHVHHVRLHYALDGVMQPDVLRIGNVPRLDLAAGEATYV